MNLINVTVDFNTEDKCLDYLEAMRWPKGVCCIACGSLKVARVTREAKSKNKRTRIYQCLEKECKHQFTPTAGTIFHDSHLPLQKWFMAIALICEAKKGVSACQMQRHLGVHYRTAWHLCHRIREAMKDDESPLIGVVELDETYIAGRVPRRFPRQHKPRPKDVVVGMIERGGRLRLKHVPRATARHIKPVVDANIAENVETIMTDDSVIYPFAIDMDWYGKRKVVQHYRTYAIGSIHTNTIENAFSLLKRGLTGTFHKVSIKHLQRYLSEFSYRFNRRQEQKQLFVETTKNLVRGKNLRYKMLTASQVSES